MVGVEESNLHYFAAEEAAAAAADIAAIDMNSEEVQGAALTLQSGFRGMQARKEAKAIKAEPKMQISKHSVGSGVNAVGQHKAHLAKHSAQALAKKQASDAAAKASRDRLAELQKAGKAKRAEEQEAAEAAAAEQAAAEAAAQEETSALAAIEAQAKADYEAKTKAIEASDTTIWEKNKAKLVLRQIEELRASEAEKAAKEAETLAKKEATAARLSWTAPTVDSKTPSEDELKQRKQKRRSWVKGESETPVSTPEAEPEFDIDAKYHRVGKAHNTMARPVKGRKTVFDQKEEEAREHKANMMQRADITASMYVQALTYTFHNEKEASEYLALQKRIMEDDLQAEGYYNVYKLPEIVTADGVRGGVGNGFMLGTIRYLTIAVGTCDQFIQLHRTYDIRHLLNADQTVQTRKQYGIQALDGWIVCQKAPTAVKDAISSWNGESWCNIRQFDCDFNTPGGWRSVAKYAKRQNKDLLLCISNVSAETPAALAKFMVKENEYVSEYNKAADDIRQGALYKGVKSPVSLVQKTSGTSAVIFRMLGAFQHVGTVQEMETASEDTMVGLASRTYYFAGPGAVGNSEISQRVDFELEGTDGMTVAVLPNAV